MIRPRQKKISNASRMRKRLKNRKNCILLLVLYCIWFNYLLCSVIDWIFLFLSMP